MAFTLNDLLVKPEGEEVSTTSPTPLDVQGTQPAPLDPDFAPAPSGEKSWRLNELVVEPVEEKIPSPNLRVEDVINDEERMGKIRRMMVETKDVYYENAPAEEVMEDFMSHMRWMNTNEVSTAKEAWDIYAADEEKRAVYGEAYKVYDEMGSMFSNGDAWNGVIDYGSAFVTSPSLWLGVGIGKMAGSAGTKVAGTAAMKLAIDSTAKQVVKKSAGKLSGELVKKELRNTAAKAAAKYHIAGAIAAEAPAAVLQDYWLQETRTKTGLQDEYNYMQGAISAVAGGVGAIPSIAILRKSSASPLAETSKLLDESYKLRAKEAAKRAAPKIKDSLKKVEADWARLVEAGKGMPENRPLEDAVFKWIFDYKDEGSLFRTIMDEGADLNFEEGKFTQGIIEYALGMGDEALAEFNDALQPLGLTFGEVTEMAAKVYSRSGEVFNPASQAKRFYNEFKGVSVAKRNAQNSVVSAAAEEVADAEVTERQFVGYAQSIWKKMLVSTFPTTAVNVKGWAIARAASSVSDVVLAGGLMGRAGIKAIIDPAGSVKDLAKVRALAANQTFALQTLVDPFLSAEAFLALLEKAPSKIQKSVSGQIFGGVDDFKPERFGFKSSSLPIKAVEKVSDTAQRISFVHVQDTLTKGVSGLTTLDREARLAFNKGITQLIEDGEAWKLTDEMWEKAMKTVLRETFSEDLSKGTHALRGVAKLIQDLSATPGIGFIVPFGKFLNNTVAFTYRHSPLSTLGVMGRAFRGKGTEDLGETLARSAVGTMALAYLVNQQEENQKEGLQWFERRTETGSIEDVTNLFPYSLYALIGRIGANYRQGQGMDTSLIDVLQQQIGPLESLSGVVAPDFIKDFARYISDPQVDDEEKGVFLSTIGDAVNYVGGTVGDIAAGYTRPLDLWSRALSTAYPQFGGGVVSDKKQARGADRFIQGVTRYTSAFINYLAGEETEDGFKLYGKSKQSALLPGPVRVPNPAGTLTGTTYQPAARHLNKVFGMVDKPPFRADEFTSGLPEYDAYINEEVTPFLDQRAKELLSNPMFKEGSQSVKIRMVNDMLKFAKSDLLSLLEGRRIGDSEDRLMNERRKLLVKDRHARIRAKEALGITTEDHQLSLYEIEAIRIRMDLEDKQFKTLK